MDHSQRRASLVWRHLVLLLFALLSPPALLNASDGPPPSKEPPPFFLGGIQTHEKDHQRWVAALHQSRMNTVQVTVYAHQGRWNSSELWYAEQEPAVLAEIRAARRNGLQVVLVLRVALNHDSPENRFLWHGLTYPNTERATRDWFKAYTDFVVRWGRIAEQEGVEVLGIASEMNSLAATLPVVSLPELPAYYLDDESQERLRRLVTRSEHLFDENVRIAMGAGDFQSLDDFLQQRNLAERRWAKAYTFADLDDEADSDPTRRIEAINRRRELLDRHWRRLIRKVRKSYSGRLTLAANFDNYHEVGFWDALDLIGINAYFALRRTLEDPVTEVGLKRAWRGIFEQVGSFREHHGLQQQVLFTELGYTRRQGVTVAPWSSDGFIPMWDPEGLPERDRAFFWDAQPFDPNERALAIQALHRVWQEEDLPLAGLLYWKLSSLEELQRVEPFMVHVGVSSRDPATQALSLFAENIRPFAPRVVTRDLYSRVTDAIVRADVEDFERLLPDLKKVRAKGRRPVLHLAVSLGRREIVERLTARGADLEERDAGGLLPIHWTCFQDQPELVDLVLPKSPSLLQDSQGETPILKCARLDNHAVLQRLLELRRDLVNLTSHARKSALYLAVDQGSLPTVKALMKAGADVKAADAENGATPMHIAARRGEMAILQALGEEGRRTRDKYENLPVHWAAYYGHLQAFRHFFEPDDTQHANPDGQGLLHFAARGGNIEILQTILPYVDDLDPADNTGQTPLFFAVDGSRPAAMRLLLERGASLAARNPEGETVLHHAASSPDPGLLQELLKQGAGLDINSVTRKGNTALHYAAGWGRTEHLRLLLAANAEILPNEDGETPLDLARRLERFRAVELMEPPTQP